MKNIVLVCKGFLIGIANIIPGVSGGTLAITLGIYEDLIKIVSHFFDNLKENVKFLLPIGIGAVLSLLLLSNIIGYSLEHFEVPTTLLFLGLILGGIPLLLKKTKGNITLSNIIVFIITFSLVLGLTFLKTSTGNVSFSNLNVLSLIILFLVGIMAAASMVIPGISGSFLLMLIGYYEPIINTIRDLTKFKNIETNILVLGIFGIGVLVGIITIAKIIEWLLKNKETKTYYGILGFVFSSCLVIILNMNKTLDITHILTGLILFIIGYNISYKLGGK